MYAGTETGVCWYQGVLGGGGRFESDMEFVLTKVNNEVLLPLLLLLLQPEHPLVLSYARGLYCDSTGWYCPKRVVCTESGYGPTRASGNGGERLAFQEEIRTTGYGNLKLRNPFSFSTEFPRQSFIIESHKPGTVLYARISIPVQVYPTVCICLQVRYAKPGTKMWYRGHQVLFWAKRQKK